MKDFSLQLYSLRHLPLQQQLELAADAGYPGVEFYTYEDYTPAELKKRLADLHLRAVGTHIGWDRLQEDLDGCVRYCVEAGIETAACPGVDLPDRDTALRHAEFLETCAERFAAEGIPFAYHNHTQEFARAGGETMLEAMLSHTKRLYSELDIFWAVYAGVDPIAFMNQYPDRFLLLHFKEMGDNKANVELGRGQLDFAALTAAGRAHNVRAFIVEQEEYTMDPAESVRVDAAFMRTL